MRQLCGSRHRPDVPMLPLDRILLHLPDGTRRVVDPLDVYSVEAAGGDALVT